VLDFMKRTSFIQLDEAALHKIGPAAVALADAEGPRPWPFGLHPAGEVRTL
jgi:histidinol dehydrogenase